jgi:hypothetical protein
MQVRRGHLEEFRRLLEDGSVQTAYRTLLSYMQGLRTRFAERNPDSAVSGLYQGYMDMTYFAVSPPPLRQRSLKIAIVFNYEAFRFEVWLAAGNRKVQRQYWEVLRSGEWPAYRLVEPAPGIDSILECDLADGGELGDPDALTLKIESAVAVFIGDVEAFLAEHDPRP